MTKGLKDFETWLSEHQELFKDNKLQIPLSELFPDHFMKKYTDFANIERLLSVGGYQLNRENSLSSVEDKKLDTLIRSRTVFNNWREMLARAGRDYVARNH